MHGMVGARSPQQNYGEKSIDRYAKVVPHLGDGFMAYVVQADIPGREDAASITLDSREDALKAARRWVADGNNSVRIIGDGRIYFPEDFEQFIRRRSSP